MSTQVVSDAVVQEMRDWLSDCTWEDVDSEEIQAMDKATIIKAVEKHYDGGLSAFLLAAG